MTMTDPIADLLTRIRNALRARHRAVRVVDSRMNREILRVLQEEGYIAGFAQVREGGRRVVEVGLKYGPSGEPAIHGLERVSSPGRRIYRGQGEIPKVQGGLGIAVLSTPKGVLSGPQARRLHVGGEVLCAVW